MPCDPKVLERIARNIREHPASADHWLDHWLDVTTRATEWDAAQWGFDPRWMRGERAELARRARSRGR